MIAIIESRKFDSNVTTVLTTVHGMMLKMVLNKGCLAFKKVQFFLTLFKRPLAPPPPFI